MANVCQAFLTRSVWESLQASSSLCSCSCSSSASSLTACPFPPRKKRLQQSCWPDTVIHYWYTKPNTVSEEPNVFAQKTASLWFHLLPFIMPSATIALCAFPPSHPFYQDASQFGLWTGGMPPLDQSNPCKSIGLLLGGIPLQTDLRQLNVKVPVLLPVLTP